MSASTNTISLSLILYVSLGVAATRLAAAVTDKALRRYRAAFAVTADSHEDRKALFAGYNKLKDIKPDQRVGACFIVSPELREWFDKLANEAINTHNARRKKIAVGV